jgi:hypothetical protein
LIKEESWDKLLLQFFNLNLVFFNFPANTLAEELEFLTGSAQAETTASENPGCSGQKFSKRKMFALGMSVPIARTVSAMFFRPS